MRSRGPGLTASPTMVGALTVMVVILAVFLAYNANTGLPFVPTYRITVQVPDANTLVPGNEVRVGGVRVGAVESIDPEQTEDGELSAALNLKLDRDVDPIPVDSTVIVRSRSALGLKYLEINLGDSDEGFEEGSVVPLSAAT
ncbi:MAG TPA: MlaD family protein, partial [Solirubrobacterales bacterium]|nr:MlaD family protein [Solirubrobacterales bacterium]